MELPHQTRPSVDGRPAAPSVSPRRAGGRGGACLHEPSHFAPSFRARDYVTGDDFQVGRCGVCHLDVTQPQPDAAAIANYYPNAYYGQAGARRFPRAVEWAQGILYEGRARSIERVVGRPGRVLDIGCGPGALLSVFRRRGWDVHGTELSEASAARARSANIPAHVGPLESWPWPDGHFDAVVMWHVLEHWADPAPVIRKVHGLLRTGGVFMVGVPNIASPEARLSRDKWFHLDVPRHLVHFTPRTLTEALTVGGFAVRERSFWAPEFDSFSFVQSALNRLGFRQNLLYNLLRGRGAKVLGGGSSLQAVGAMLLAAPLGVLSVPATALLALSEHGSALTLKAIKLPAP